MADFLGSRISLISKSDIRYVGILHEINSTQSTVSLENVRSYGTEGRRKGGADEIMPSDQIYDYIVFRGSDVKDLRIEDHPSIKENKPPIVPDDPAIVGARPRMTDQPVVNLPSAPPVLQNVAGHSPAPRFMQPPQPNPAPFYGVAPAAWGRAGPGLPPAHPTGFMGMPYAPPPGWYPHGFHPPPVGYPYPQPPGPSPGGVPAPAQVQAQVPSQGQIYPENTPIGHSVVGTGNDAKPIPIGPRFDRAKGPNNSLPSWAAATPATQVVAAAPVLPPVTAAPLVGAAPSGLAATGMTPAQLTWMNERAPPGTAPATSSMSPAPPAAVESLPSVENIQAITAGSTSSPRQDSTVAAPAGPRNHRVMPVIPLSGNGPKQVPQRDQRGSERRPTITSTRSAPSGVGGELKDATEAAKAAVAIAMAQLSGTISSPAPGPSVQTSAPPPLPMAGNGMDNLTAKVNEMRIHASRTGHQGRGRSRGPRAPNKVEVPATDFDFQGSNARFNKDAMGQKPQVGQEVRPDDPVSAVTETEDTTPECETAAIAGGVYNRSASFFDNISSEAKDRADNSSQKPGGREWRSKEQMKNQRKDQETFGASSVDDNRYYGRGRSYRGRPNHRGGHYNHTTNAPRINNSG